MALTDTVRLILTADDLSKPAFTSMIANTQILRDEMGKLNTVMIAQRGYLTDLVTGYDGLRGALGTTITSFTGMRDASAGATTAIRTQIGAISDLAIVARTAAPDLALLRVASSGGGVPVAPVVTTPIRTLARTVAQDEQLLRARPLASMGARAVGAPEGLVSSLGGAALGPVGLTLAGAGYLGFKSATEAATYQSAIRQTEAQSNPNQNPALVEQAARKLSQDILTFTTGGTSFYKATPIATSIEPMLAHFSEQAAIQALPALQALSMQNKAPNLTDAATLTNTLAQNFGLGPKSTGAQLTGLIDFISRAEQLTTVPPGQITTALPRLFSSLAGTGISKEEGMGLFLKAAAGNPSARIDSQAMQRLFTELTTKNTVGATKEFGTLGLATGPGALDLYGGIYPYLQMIQQKTLGASGGDVQKQRALLAKLFPQQNALNAYIGIMQGGGIQQAMGFTTSLGQAGGNSARVQAELSQGITQQATMLMTHFNADMITLGDTLNNTVMPALLHMADVALHWLDKSAVPAVGSFLGDVGKTLDAGAKTGHMGLTLDTSSPGTVTGSLIRDTYGNFFQAMGDVGNGLDAAARFTNLPSHFGAGHAQAAAAGQGAASVTPSLTQSDPAALARARAVALAAAPGAYQPDQSYTGIGGVAHARLVAQQAAHERYQAEFDARQRARAAASARGTVTLGTGNDMSFLSAINAHRATAASATDRRLEIAAMAASERGIAGTGSNQPVMNARADINSLLASGGTITQFTQALTTLAKDLPGSAYSSNVRQRIYAQESTKVGRYEFGGAQANLTAGLAQFKAGQIGASDLQGLLQLVALTAPLTHAASAGATLTKDKLAVGTAIYQDTQLKAATTQLQAAQIFADSVRIHHGSVQQQMAAAQGIYHASVNLTGVGKLTGLAKQDALNKALDTLNTSIVALTGQYITQAQQGVSLAQLQHDPVAEQRALTGEIQTYTKNANVLFGPNGTATTSFKLATLPLITQRAQAGLTPLQEQLQLAQGAKNPAAIHAAVVTELAYYATNKSAIFGKDTTAYQLAIQPLQQLLKGVITPGVQLLRPTVAGLGALPMAGFGASTARLAGGSADAQSRLIAAMQAQITALQQALRIANAQLAAQNKGNTTADKIERNTRPHAATPNPARGHALDHIRLAV